MTTFEFKINFDLSQTRNENGRDIENETRNNIMDHTDFEIKSVETGKTGYANVKLNGETNTPQKDIRSAFNNSNYNVTSIKPL